MVATVRVVLPSNVDYGEATSTAMRDTMDGQSRKIKHEINTAIGCYQIRLG